MLTASQDGTARVWHANGRSDPLIVRRLGRAVEAAVFMDDGSRLAIASPGRQREVTMWSLDGTVEPAVITLTRQRRPVTGLRFSPTAGHFVTVDLDGTARVWSTDPDATPFVTPWGDTPVTAATFSPDDASIVSASRDDTVRVWRAAQTARESTALALGEHQNVSAVTFAPDGRQVVTTSRDGTIKRWNVAGGGVLSSFGDSGGPQVVAAIFGPADEPLMTVSANNAVQLWDPTSGDSLATFDGHESPLTGATFSPDGTRVVTASRDGTAWIWNVDGTGDPVVLKDDNRPILAAAFSGDGRYVFTVSDDGVVRRWTTITHELLREGLKSATNRCLEPDFRERYLGQPEEEARARYRACETEHGR